MPLRSIVLTRDYNAWRTQVRALLSQAVDPAHILWQEAADAQLLLVPGQDPGTGMAGGNVKPVRVPKEFAEIAEDVFHHRDGQRFALLYRLLWRLTHGERNLLEVEVDDDVRQAVVMQRQVRWDMHRMNGFVRFEKVTDQTGELFLAWYRPDHYVTRRVARDFARRFGDMRWSILTPDDSAHWDLEELTFGPGVPKRPATSDQLVKLWQTYYAATYNPMRHNPKLMRQHVPARFLENMPEADTVLPPPKRYARQG